MNSTNKHPFPALVGDIGGTNARFRMVADRNQPPQTFEIVRTADFASIEEAIETAVLPHTELKPKTAIIAAAGPITAQGLNLTNCHWNIKPQQFLETGLVEEIVLMNDFEAQALSLPALQSADYETIGAGQLTNDESTKVVLGPGTGLGVALLVRAGGKWVPVAGEGGHVDLGPRTVREAEIWRHLEAVEGRISAEQVVCGFGLCNLYRACCAVDNAACLLSEPSEISAAAMNGSNNQAVEALSLFCTCLGRVAGDLAVTAMARGGVYISGGIAQKILPFLVDSPFRAAFEDKAPHTELTRQMATVVVTHELPALVGLTAYARNQETFILDVSHRRWRK